MNTSTISLFGILTFVFLMFTGFKTYHFDNLNTPCLTCDADNDLVPDYLDLDDDNDGIVDTIECPLVNFLQTSTTAVNTQTFNLNGLEVSISSDAIPFAQGSGPRAGELHLFQNGGALTSNVQISFSKPITGFELTLDDFDASDEFLSNFNAFPSCIEGTDMEFANANTQVISTVPSGSAKIVWSGLPANTNSITFTHNRLNNLIGVFFSKLQVSGLDFDGDGLANCIDRDSDGDGIYDIIEAGGIDVDMDGAIDYPTLGDPASMVDADNDGLADNIDDQDSGDPTNEVTSGTPLTIPNTDLTGAADFLDIDSDDDGITDNVEGQTTDDFLAPSASDTDADGIDDAYDINCSPCGSIQGMGIGATNSDNTDEPDFRDLDADNDGVNDKIEGHDSNGDGRVDVLDTPTANTGMAGGTTDIDGDGLLDGFDNDTANSDPTNSGLNPESHPDVQGNTLEQDWREGADFDGDGVADAFDLDVDNDGIPDVVERCGVVTSIQNVSAGLYGTTSTPDLTGQGEGSSYTYDIVDENNSLTFRMRGTIISTDNDVVRWWFLDDDPRVRNDDNNSTTIFWEILDPVGNPALGSFKILISDLDGSRTETVTINLTEVSGYGITPTSHLAIQQTGNVISFSGTTNDNTDDDALVIFLQGKSSFSVTYSNSLVTGFSTTASYYHNMNRLDLTVFDLCDADADEDGVPNYLDLDSDNDGVPDIVEAGGVDTDGNGQVDYVSSNDPTTMVDLDNDGLADAYDDTDSAGGTPGWVAGTPLIKPDTDNDNIADALDLDSDNDGIPDVSEAGGTDADGDGLADNFADTDGDGFHDPVDGDVGNDWISENTINALQPTGIDTNNDGFPDSFPEGDLDKDGLLDFRDLDADNDGLPDVVESGGTDTDGDGFADAYVDTDGDGLNDIVDGDVGNFGPAENASNAQLLTGLDTDSDGAPDSYPSDDSDQDGNLDFLDLDADNDGIPDVVESGGTDSDGDGFADNFVDSDADGFNDIVDGDVGNDGIPENINNAQQRTGADTDGNGAPDSITSNDFDNDGMLNQLDLDADNDGINDVLEAGGTDADQNGFVDNFTDPDNDGFNNSVDGDPNNDTVADATDNALLLTGVDADFDGAPDSYPNENTDNTSNPDFLDIDSDDDGIVDNTEAQATTNYIAPTSDSDNDGLSDAYEIPATIGVFGGAGLTPVNSDSNGKPDFQDTDADDDGIDDDIEGHDTNGDGFVGPLDSPAANTGRTSGIGGADDIDGDGLLDGYDNDTALNDPTNGGLNPESHPDVQVGTDEQDWREGIIIVDTDGDGVPDDQEVVDGTDPNNPCEFIASSVITLATSVSDCDGDGVTNADEINGPDGAVGGNDGTDPNDPCIYNINQITLVATSVTDCDGDGVTNADEINGPDGTVGGFDGTDPNNPCDFNLTQITVVVTSTGDCDGDGVTNAQEALDGTDPLNLCDYNAGNQVTANISATWNAFDCDGDGVTNEIELIDGTNPVDPCNYNSVSQVIANISAVWNNLDCDGDGVSNGQEIIDGTNPQNSCDYNPGSITLPVTGGSATDCDGDGVPNADEITDGTDPQNPCDFISASISVAPASMWNNADCDGDGVTNGQEILDGTDPLNNCDYSNVNQVIANVDAIWNNTDCDGDGVTNGQEILDNSNPQDLCDYNVASQATPTITWNNADCDGDGVSNDSELNDGTNPSDPCDYTTASITLAQSGTWNALDCDEDGVTNGDEIADGTDPRNPCDFNMASVSLAQLTAWNNADCDGDGVTNEIELIDGTNPVDPCNYNSVSQVIANISAVWNNLDCDGDGVTNGQEIIDGTNPQNSCDYNPGSITLPVTGGSATDCDGDGVPNADEITDGTDPQNPCDFISASISVAPASMWNNADCDGDGVTNGQEILDGTDPLNNCDYSNVNQVIANVDAIWNNTDCDGDGVTNGQEILDNSNPQDLCDYDAASQATPTIAWNNEDCDGDGVSNDSELNDGTNPSDPCDYTTASITLAQSGTWNALDCDEDGVTNGDEITDGTDPRNPCDFNMASVSLAQLTAWNNADCDGDGVTNGVEVADGTDPTNACDYSVPSQVLANVTSAWNNADCDGDGVSNGQEIIDGTNPQNSCDYNPGSITLPVTGGSATDCDGDGVPNADEITDGTDPQNPCDFISASISVAPASMWNNADCDGDGVTNGQEILDGTDPLNNCDYSNVNQVIANVDAIWNNTDCDGDGVTNGQEILDNSNPQDLCDYNVASQATPTITWNNADCDGDGVSNDSELNDGTNPSDPCDYTTASITLAQSGTWNALDCDEDGVTNGDEITDGTDPRNPCDFNMASVSLAQLTAWNNADCDGDGVTNGVEVADGTDPANACDYSVPSQVLANVTSAWNNADCDGDGVTNGFEILDGTDPADLCDYDVSSVSVATSTAWNIADCDNDGINNNQEVLTGSNPLDTCDPILPEISPTVAYNQNADCSLSDLTLVSNASPGAGAIISYSWTGPNGFTSNGINPLLSNASANINGTYVLTVVDENGCSATSNLSIQDINDQVVQPQISRSGSQCIGESITLSISQYQASGVTYNWTFPGNGSNITGLGTNEITVNPLSDLDEGNYAVQVVINGTCSVSSNPLNIALNDAIEVVISNSNTDCLSGDDNIQLNANISGGSGVYEVLWTGPEGFSSVDLNPVIPNATNANSGNYTITVTDPIGCEISTSTVLDISNLPVTPEITVSNTFVCEGENVQLSVPSYDGTVVEYTWIAQGTSTTSQVTPTSTLTLIDAVASQTGAYSVYVTVDGCQSLVSESEFITISSTLSTPGIFAPEQVCEGENIPLATNTVAQSYQWSGPNGFTSTAQNPTVVTNATLANSGVYSLIVSNNGCSSNAASVSVSVASRPLTPTLLLENAICEGNDIILTAIGTSATSYQWISPSTDLNGSFGTLGDPNNPIWTSNNTTMISQATHPQFYEDGTWRVRAVSSNGCYSELSIGQELSINSIPVQTIVSNSGPVCLGQPLQLMAEEVPNASYKWYNDDPYATPNTATVVSTLKDPVFNELPIGDYSFYLTVEVNGCVSPTAAKTDASVLLKPTVDAILNTGPYCEGTSVILLAPTIPGATYSWTGPNGFTSFEEDPVILEADLQDEGVYTLIVSLDNALCASDPVTTNVFVNNIPETPTASIDGAICEGTSLQLIGSDVPTGNTAEYFWTGPDGFTSDLQNPMIENATMDNAGEYLLQVMVNGCPSLMSAPVNVIVNESLLPPIATNPTSDFAPACSGSEVQLSTNFILGATYEWYGPTGLISDLNSPILTDIDENDEGLYQVFVTMNGCTSPAGQTIIYTQSTPQVPVVLDEPAVCQGEDLTLSVVNTNPGESYDWYELTTNNFLGNGAELEFNNVTQSSAGTYFVIASVNGCESDPTEELPTGGNAMSTVEVHIPSPDVAYAGADVHSCETFIDLQSNPLTAWSGEWSSLNNNASLELLSPTNEATRVINLEEGENIVLWSIISGACGITSQDTLIINYDLGPEATDDNYTTTIGTAVESNVLNNDATNTNQWIISITNEVANGDLSIDQDGAFVYTPRGGFVGVDEFTYEICNPICEDNCATATVRIDVGGDVECYAPTAFTPNGNGVNDTFIIPCIENYEGSVLCVYNRWGDEVFHSEDYRNDWAGTFNEETLPVGTYFYIATINDGSDTVLKGYVYIQR